jgi:hypothetical protein
MESSETLNDFSGANTVPVADGSQICTSPKRAGALPATASLLPSGEKASDSMRGDSPTRRATMFDSAPPYSRTS